jgi:DNA polymerase-2
MNAFYGVLGTSACRFFDPRLASSITMRGHEIMRQTKALIESQGYDVIYGDTDSTFVWLKKHITRPMRHVLVTNWWPM